MPDGLNKRNYPNMEIIQDLLQTYRAIGLPVELNEAHDEKKC